MHWVYSYTGQQTLSVGLYIHWPTKPFSRFIYTPAKTLSVLTCAIILKLTHTGGRFLISASKCVTLPVVCAPSSALAVTEKQVDLGQIMQWAEEKVCIAQWSTVSGLLAHEHTAGSITELASSRCPKPLHLPFSPSVYLFRLNILSSSPSTKCLIFERFPHQNSACRLISYLL
jgi:hypothetical protein